MRIRFWTAAVLGAVLGFGGLVGACPTALAAHAQSADEQAGLALEMQNLGNFTAAHQEVLVPLIYAFNAPQTKDLLDSMFAFAEEENAPEFEKSLDEFEAFAAEVLRNSLEAESALPPVPEFPILARDNPSGARDLVKLAQTVEANTNDTAKELRSVPVRLADTGRAMLKGDDEAMDKANRLLLSGIVTILNAENNNLAAQISLMERRGQPARQLLQLQLKNNQATMSESELDLSNFEASADESADARASRHAPFTKRMQRDVSGWESVESRGRAQIAVFEGNMRQAMSEVSDPALRSLFKAFIEQVPNNFRSSFDIEAELMKLMERRIELLVEDGPDMEAELERILEQETRLGLQRIDLATQRTALLQ